MSSVSESSWFNILRMAGAVTTTSGGTASLFNVRYGGGKKRGKKKKARKEEDSDSRISTRIGRRIRDRSS